MRFAFVALAAAGLSLSVSLGGCAGGAGGASEPAVSEAGLEIVPLTVVSDGRRHLFRVEVARTAAQQSRGMMFRDRLAPDRGMMFPFSEPRAASFWMKDTPNSLDLIFVGTDGKIESIGADAVPLSPVTINSIGVVAGVLEIAGGRAAELGLKPGDVVEWAG